MYMYKVRSFELTSGKIVKKKKEEKEKRKREREMGLKRQNDYYRLALPR